MTNTPWAVLLFKFKDDKSEPWPRNRYEEIFTSAGNGRFNMVDFFADMSHGELDLGGSQVFGWYTLDKAITDYKGSGANPQGRMDLFTWVQQAATDAGDDLSGFSKLLIISNVPSDLFGTVDRVALGDGRAPSGSVGEGMVAFSPSIAGQEMGHGYGLNHSRLAGTAADYTDPYDIMSTATDFMAPHPVYRELDPRANPIFRIGPGLNAASMWAMNWLDLGRVWTGGGYDGPAGNVVLRPLHRRDLPGYLCARVGDYFVEFRMNEFWDAEFRAPGILVHSYSDGHSYLHQASSGASILAAGDVFSEGYTADPPTIEHGPGFKISVLNIDAADRSATVRVQVWHRTRHEVGPATVFGGVANDGGGWIILNGQVIRIPPRSPLLAILEPLVDAAQGASIRDGVARTIALERAYGTVAAQASTRATELRAFREPAMSAVKRLSQRSPID